MLVMRMKVCDILLKWLVPLVCAAINFHHFGLTRVSSLLFVESIDRYNIDRKQASVPHVIRLMMSHLAAPFAGFLSGLFGNERLIMFGCLLLPVSIAACYFAEDILVVTVFWGVLNGIGLAMAIHLQAAIILSHHKRNLTMAYGISSAGSSIGGLVYSPICKILLDMFGISGTFLILSALSLHAVPAVMLLFLPNISKKDPSKEKEAAQLDNLKPRRPCKQEPNTVSQMNIVSMSSPFDITKDEQITKNKYSKSLNSEQKSIVSLDGRSLNAENSFDIAIAGKTDNASETETASNNGFSIDIDSDLALQNNVICTQYLEDDIENCKSINASSNLTVREQNDAVKDTRVESVSETNNVLPHIRAKSKSTRSELNIFYDPLFLLLTFIQSTFLVTLVLYYTFLADYVKDRGLNNHDAAVILMYGSIADLLGRLSLGWVTDRGFISVLNFSAILYFCHGIGFMALALSTEMIELTLFFAMIGYTLGGIMAVLPAFTYHVFADKKAMALSSRFILFVPLSLTVFPLIDYFREKLGSYAGMYYSLTGICFLDIVLIFLISYFMRRRRKIKERN